MRAGIWVSVAVLGWGQSAMGQAAQSPPARVFTPEQRAVQEQTRQLDAQRTSLVAQAKQVFAAEMEREKAGDCHGADTQAGFNDCFGKAEALADESLKSYEAAIRGVLGLKYPAWPGEETPPSRAGSSPGPEQDVAEFDHLEKLWHEYLEAGATAAHHELEGGSGAGSFAAETRLRLERDHLRELHDIYGELWI